MLRINISRTEMFSHGKQRLWKGQKSSRGRLSRRLQSVSHLATSLVLIPDHTAVWSCSKPGLLVHSEVAVNRKGDVSKLQ